MAEPHEIPITLREVAAYCWMVFRRAFREFVDAFGWNKTTVIGGLIYLAVLAWRYRTKGRPAMLEEAEAWRAYLANAVTPTLIVAGIVTLLCIVKAAAHIHKEQSTLLLNAPDPAPLPEISVKIIEAFIHPETSLCFVHFSLHNNSPAECGLASDVQAYSLSLKLKGSDTLYDKHRVANVFDRYYLSIFEDDVEYSEEGYPYETSREVDKEPLLSTRDVLSRGRPLDRWIGFQLRGLPPWPYMEEPRGQHEEVHFDESTGDVEVEWVTDYDRVLLTDNIESMTLTVVDPFDREHSGSKSAPFSKYGRGVVRREAAIKAHHESA